MRRNRETNLYHCTKEDSLIKIIESKFFKYSYCIEPYYGHKGTKYRLEKLAYAMVCFADMYADELPDHMKQFSSNSYIMMDKKWAENKQISPVIYYNKNSRSNWAFLSMNNRKEDLSGYTNNEDIEKICDMLEKSIELIRPLFKQYKGKYYINGTDKESENEVEFFLEREWRSFPFVTGGEHLHLDLNDYKNPETRGKYQNELLEHGYCLAFDWNDILQIGCRRKKKKEILKTIQKSFGVSKKEARKKIKIIHPALNHFSKIF